METRTNFNRVTGDRAYSIWFGYNGGDAKYFDAMMTVELDLELITGSSGKVYAYLKEIGDMAEIPHDKPWVSHLARKTLACTVGLANGMNIGVLSKLLEHSSIQITLDSYSTVIDELMISNVRDLKEKLSNQD